MFSLTKITALRPPRSVDMNGISALKSPMKFFSRSCGTHLRQLTPPSNLSMAFSSRPRIAGEVLPGFAQPTGGQHHGRSIVRTEVLLDELPEERARAQRAIRRHLVERDDIQAPGRAVVAAHVRSSTNVRSTRSIGMSTAANVVIGRATRSSRTSKSSAVSPETGLPSLSVTMTLSCTASTDERNVGGGCGGACAAEHTPLPPRQRAKGDRPAPSAHSCDWLLHGTTARIGAP